MEVHDTGLNDGCRLAGDVSRGLETFVGVSTRTRAGLLPPCILPTCAK
jgi:hypothetical protein